MASVDCNLCGSNNIRVLFHNNLYEIVRCNRCGLVYLNYSPSIEELKNFYSKEYFKGAKNREAHLDYLYEREVLDVNFRKRLSKIEELSIKGKILDIGCAMGFFLAQAKIYNWDTHGVEISEFASTYARNELHLNVFTGDFLDVDFSNNIFDVITMWDTIEHLRDPSSCLLKAYDLMNDYGLLVLSTGDIDSILARIMGKYWHIISSPQHLFYFSATTVTKILNKAGFEVINIDHSGKYVDLKFIFHRLDYWLDNRLFGWLNLLIQYVVKSNIKVYINTGDIMTVHARK